jgi:hypothetical protein
VVASRRGGSPARGDGIPVPETKTSATAPPTCLGFSTIYVHNVTVNQQAFIEVFGERVLPALTR